MATDVGYQTLIGHSGTLTFGSTAQDCTILSMDSTHSWKETEIRSGAGITTGFDGRDNRLSVRLTAQPTKATAITAMAECPAPFSSVTLAGFNAPGSTKGQSDVNGIFMYVGGFSVKQAAGQVVEFSMNLLQTTNLPT